MFSLLDLMNKFLGYINVNPKVKNRIYSILGFFGNGYIGYVAWRYLQNKAYTQGFLYLLMFLVLLYFAILNLIYYFTDKQAKFDISPLIEKMLGGPHNTTEVAAANPLNQAYANAGIVDHQKLLPAQVTLTSHHQTMVHELVHQLAEHQPHVLDYEGRSDKELQRALKHTSSLEAIGRQGQLVPYAEIKVEQGKLILYGGLNALSLLPIGEISQVGLAAVKDVHQRYRLSAAQVKIIGGPEKILGRSGVLERLQPYQIVAQLAYRPRTEQEQQQVQKER